MILPLLRGAVLWLVVASWCVEAAAIITVQGGGSVSSMPPAEDPGFANVGAMEGAGVYIGDGWVLTAHHLGMQSISLQGRSYAPEPETEVQLETDSGRKSDLLLFRLRDAPDLPEIRLARRPPSPGDEVVMIGNGRAREAAMSSWDAGWQRVPEEESVHRGWRAVGPKQVRWGTNTIAATVINVSERGMTSRSFSTVFDEEGATTHEAQSTPGDSGGGVFAARDGSWELVGIINAIGVEPGQSATQATFGSQTLSIDISFYRDQIRRATGRLRGPRMANSWVAWGLLVGAGGGIAWLGRVLTVRRVEADPETSLDS
jgi:hypothetical protein